MVEIRSQEIRSREVRNCISRCLIPLLFLIFQFSFLISSSAQEVLLPLQTIPQQRMASKTVSEPVTLPFFEDFSNSTFHLSPFTFHPEGGATVSDGVRLLPPTVGVVTLDALDASGNLYPFASTSLFPADTLTSLPIRLDGFSHDDSLVLSFYFLPGGGEGNLWERVGDAPDPQDSLMLEFFSSVDSVWTIVWSCGGMDVDSLVAITGHRWQYVSIPITERVYFDSLFQFRFRNFCSLTETTKPGLAGNCDFWHIDYILLDSDRTTNSTPVFRDVAFVDPAPSALAAYRAMPARQYRTTDMADAFDMRITNLFNSTLATQYAYAVVDATGDTLYRYDGGYENAPAFLPDESYQTAPSHATPPIGYSFPVSSNSATYTIVHTVREGAAGDDYRTNDTVRYQQVFDNYYAYDDGSAENGYGLTSTSSHLYLAYRFDLNTADTLTALDLYFNRTNDGANETVPFRITVWKAENGHPGTVLYRDNSNRRPLFDGLNRYQRYVLESPVVVNGSIFVGFEQSNNYYINLGFDRSHNTSDRIYYLTTTEWQQSILSGSLMMRPCFGAAATVGIGEVESENSEVVVYPNPAKENVIVQGLPDGSHIEIYDASGRQVQAFTYRLSPFTVHLPNGLYLLRCITPNGTTYTEKLIIRK